MKEILKKIASQGINDVELMDKKRTVILSGQSNIESFVLSEDQKKFLNIFKNNGYQTIDCGFPYFIDPKAQKNSNNSKVQSYYEKNIFVKSYRNIVQFLFLIFDKDYKKLIASHLQKYFNNAGEIVLICQSQGLKMMEESYQFLDIHKDLKIKIIALGPVTFSRWKILDKRFELTVIKGKWDFISKLFDMNSADYRVDSGHMGYISNKKLFQIVKENII